MPEDNSLNGSVPHNSAPLGTAPHHSETFRSVPNDSDSFRTIPRASEPFRSAPQRSEEFRTVPPLAERKASHTLTTREVARMFEDAGVARTERTIVKWCQAHGGAPGRLDAFYDPNERRYFITQESVERAIKEEQSKAVRPHTGSDSFGSVRNDADDARTEHRPESNNRELEELRHELVDLKIANRFKEQFIAQLQLERDKLLDRAIEQSRAIGQLEMKVAAVEPPRRDGNESVRLRVKSHPADGDSNSQQPTSLQG